LERVNCRTFSAAFLAMLVISFPRACPSEAFPPQPRGEEIMPGLEWVVWQGGDPRDACVVRVDPDLLIMRPLYFKDKGEAHPLTLRQWMEKSGANLIFNAGQYYPDYSYMGFLMSDGKPIKTKVHPIFQGMLLAEPLEATAPKAKILDLAEDPFDPSTPGYKEAAQSFMLFDRHGTIRVKRTSNLANRTVLVEQRDGKFLIVVTRVPFTLWELAKALLEGPFPVRQAISMDGGDEAQIAIKSKDFSYAQASGMVASELKETKPLPTVIGIFPRANPSTSSR
jgi:hypothetical protein